MLSKMRFIVFLLVLAVPALGHEKVEAAANDGLEEKWGADWAFTGISTFAHLKHVRCLTHREEDFEIGIIGAPFDTAVTYRPGARFGPKAIRAASSRQGPTRGFNPRAGLNPYSGLVSILDCGDIPITPFSSQLALTQMTAAFTELYTRRSASGQSVQLLTLGGDHSIALPALRALHKVHGEPISVLHFDAHLDTWAPDAYPSGYWDPGMEQSQFNHGSMFWMAGNEGLIAVNRSVHAGLRTRLTGDGWEDDDDDDRQGWLRIATDDIDEGGVKGVVSKIMNVLGTERKVYLSLDIDVIDPGLAPATGTPEPGGWTTREVIQILRGIDGLNLIGADIVEVSPAYDGPGEQTSLAAAQVGYEILTSMVKRRLHNRMHGKTNSEDTSELKEEL